MAVRTQGACHPSILLGCSQMLNIAARLSTSFYGKFLIFLLEAVALLQFVLNSQFGFFLWKQNSQKSKISVAPPTG